MTFSRFGSIFFFCFSFLLFFSVFRLLHDSDVLTFTSLINNLSLLDYDFSETINKMTEVRNMFDNLGNLSWSVGGDDIFQALKNFFLNIGTIFTSFFNMLMIPLFLIYDVVLFLLSILRFLAFLLGYAF